MLAMSGKKTHRRAAFQEKATSVESMNRREWAQNFREGTEFHQVTSWTAFLDQSMPDDLVDY